MQKHSRILSLTFKIQFMKWLKYSLIIVCFIACHTVQKKVENTSPKPSGTYYLIQTEYGDLKIRLFDETPLHKANFEKLVADKYFDSTLFHRVIQNFMVQGGDPNSKNAPSGTALGNGGPDYTIPAEFVDSLVHKKGALAAARQGDQVNPEKRSSGSQFYIVQGQPTPAETLTQIERQISNSRKNSLGIKFYKDPKNAPIKEKIAGFRTSGNQDSINFYIGKINKMVEDSSVKLKFNYSEKNKQNYILNGGTPHLDGAYTVFGEVVTGLNVLDSIAKAPKDSRDRPLKDIRMTIKKL